MIQSDILSYINLIKYLETEVSKCNPYDPCVANKIIEGDPLTVIFHVDDAKESHKGKKVGKKLNNGLT